MYRIVNNFFTFISKYTSYIFLTPNYRSFGNCAEEIFYGIIKAKKENKRLILCIPRIPFVKRVKKFIPNIELYYVEHPQIVSSSSIIVQIFNYICGFYAGLLYVSNFVRRKVYESKLIIFLRSGKRYQFFFLNEIPSWNNWNLWVPEAVKEFDWTLALKRDWSKSYKDYDPPTINNSKLIKAESDFKKMGLTPGAWFVCLHVPETPTILSMRQASIKNYLDAINYIVSKGGWVIRIGDRNNPKLPNLENVIDYAHEDNTPLGNLYAISKCRFLIGCTSGPANVARLFGKKVVGTNLAQLAHDYCPNISIIKHIYDKKLEKFLSLQDILDGDSETQFFEDNINNYELHENSSDEILALVREVIEKEGHQPTELQINFSLELKKTVTRFIKDEGYPEQWRGVKPNEMYIYKYRAVAEGPISRDNFFLANFFLEKYLENSKDEESEN